MQYLCPLAHWNLRPCWNRSHMGKVRSPPCSSGRLQAKFLNLQTPVGMWLGSSFSHSDTLRRIRYGLHCVGGIGFKRRGKHAVFPIITVKFGGCERARSRFGDCYHPRRCHEMFAEGVLGFTEVCDWPLGCSTSVYQHWRVGFVLKYLIQRIHGSEWNMAPLVYFVTLTFYEWHSISTAVEHVKTKAGLI